MFSLNKNNSLSNDLLDSCEIISIPNAKLLYVLLVHICNLLKTLLSHFMWGPRLVLVVKFYSKIYKIALLHKYINV